KGFVLTGADAGATEALETSVPGVYAAGDVRSGSIKRCATAVGEGAAVVRFVHEHLVPAGQHASTLLGARRGGAVARGAGRLLDQLERRALARVQALGQQCKGLEPVADLDDPQQVLAA